jgi:hypothetical protein
MPGKHKPMRCSTAQWNAHGPATPRRHQVTHEETVLLTRYIKACCPQQAMDEFTADAWHDLLADLGLEECRAAVVTVAKRQPFVAASEIRAEVKRARSIQTDRARTEAAIGPVRRQRDALADPRPLRSAIRELVTAQWPGRRAITAGDADD